MLFIHRERQCRARTFLAGVLIASFAACSIRGCCHCGKEGNFMSKHPSVNELPSGHTVLLVAKESTRCTCAYLRSSKLSKAAKESGFRTCSVGLSKDGWKGDGATRSPHEPFHGERLSLFALAGGASWPRILRESIDQRAQLEDPNSFAVES